MGEANSIKESCQAGVSGTLSYHNVVKTLLTLLIVVIPETDRNLDPR